MLGNADVLAIIAVLAVALGTILISMNTRVAPIERFSAGNNFDVALSVTKAYKDVLQRTPTEAELLEYHDRLLSDSEFDVSALEASLRESGEYRRLMRLQSESANPGLEGTLTEAQVLAKLRAFYRAEVGVDPDEATLLFLRERYRRTRLDDEYIKELIASISMAGETRARAAAKRKDKAGESTQDEPLDMPAKSARDMGGKNGVGADDEDDDEEDPDAYGGAGDGSAGKESDAARAIDTREADQLTALCAKLGVSADKALAGNMSGDALLGGRCPGLGDVPGDMLSQRVSQRQIEGTASITCRAARAAQAAELSRAGYVIPPERLGSWSVPQKHPPICKGTMDAGKAVWGPVNSQTALIGTPLDAAKEMEGKYDDLVLM
jgi:ribosomal protein L12E/L44/L45/RPP1/RPP2